MFVCFFTFLYVYYIIDSWTSRAFPQRCSTQVYPGFCLLYLRIISPCLLVHVLSIMHGSVLMSFSPSSLLGLSQPYSVNSTVFLDLILSSGSKYPVILINQVTLGPTIFSMGKIIPNHSVILDQNNMGWRV